MDQKIHTATGFDMYTVFSLWDTFRAEHPLLTIIDQKRTLDFIKSLLAKYDESTVLPVWELAANETWCMIGYHSVPVIVDAYMKGIRGFDAEKAFAAMKHSARLDHFGLKAYREHGLIPAEMEAESVSKTLEYAYDDWCIAIMAQLLGKNEDVELFMERAQYYKNVFDPSTGFMRARPNGMWVEPFDPAAVTQHYTEANAWQYSFFVPQDVNGLIALMGGKDRFIEKLDALFQGPSVLTGREQVDISGLVGQYAQGNEPSHHVAYLYNYAGAPWKTQATVRRIMETLYHERPDGLCGNDDCGQMSAWYLMSAMGLYQVTPGQPVYCLGSPLFSKVTVHLENGKTFVIRAQNNSPTNRYVQSARLRGKPLTRSYVTHEEIIGGGELVFEMGPKPNAAWAKSSDGSPRSGPLGPFVAVPYIQSTGGVIVDKVEVALSCLMPGVDIYYTLNGEAPTVQSLKYTSPIVLQDTTTVKAIAASQGKLSKVLTAKFVKHVPVGTIKLNSAYDPLYTGGGDRALIDGQRGTANFRVGAWQGYHRNDLDATVDLGERRDLSAVSLGCLQNIDAWVFFPVEVEFSFSDDGVSFRDAIVVKNDVSPQDERVLVREFGKPLAGIQARYVRVRAKNVGVCPPWHKGAGGDAWLFANEITIQPKSSGAPANR
jgi:hypothetical protein